MESLERRDVPSGSAPVAMADSYQLPHDRAYTVGSPGVLSNDHDPENDAMTAVLYSNPTHGTLTLNANGSFTYTPTAGYTGADSFAYRAFDGTGYSAPTTVSLQVINQAPVAQADAFSLVHDHTLTVAAPGLLANDGDPNQDSLTVSAHTNPAHGTLTINANGSFTYTPAAGYIGTDSFTYTITDGLASATATVSLTITNQAPLAQNDTYSLSHDHNLTIAAPGVLANDGDPNQDALTVSAHTNPAHGTVTINTDGSFSYTPAAGYVGTDSFTYTITDGVASSTATVTLTITNQAPVAQNDAYTIIHDQFLDTVAANLPGVLANDNDPNGDPITAVLVIGPAHGTLTLQANGTFLYTPNALYVGADTFTYKAFDGAAYSSPATVTIQALPSRAYPVSAGIA